MSHKFDWNSYITNKTFGTIEYEVHQSVGINQSTGCKYWYHNRKLHREDGPAVENVNGLQIYYYHGKLHREDGPAIVWANGKEEYWLNSKQYSKEEFLLKLKKVQFRTTLIEENKQ